VHEQILPGIFEHFAIFTECMLRLLRFLVQIQVKSPVSVTYAKRQANAMTEKVADMIDKVASPVVQALPPNRVGLCVSLMQRACATLLHVQKEVSAALHKLPTDLI